MRHVNKNIYFWQDAIADTKRLENDALYLPCEMRSLIHWGGNLNNRSI
jgi:hypothetical protein